MVALVYVTVAVVSITPSSLDLPTILQNQRIASPRPARMEERAPRLTAVSPALRASAQSTLWEVHVKVSWILLLWSNYPLARTYCCWSHSNTHLILYQQKCLVWSPEQDFCNPNPCSHNGVCAEKINGWQCVCKEGWKGDRCKGKPGTHKKRVKSKAAELTVLLAIQY